MVGLGCQLSESRNQDLKCRQELLCAQVVPLYEQMWKAGGHEAAPIHMDGISYTGMRRMAGNSFNQAVATTFVAYVLGHLRKV